MEAYEEEPRLTTPEAAAEALGPEAVLGPNATYPASEEEKRKVSCAGCIAMDSGADPCACRYARTICSTGD